MTLRSLLIAILLAGVLIPVVSTADDYALLSTAIGELTPARPVEVRNHVISDSQYDSSAVFWVQFEHMDRSAPAGTAPVIEHAGMVCAAESPAQAVHANPRSGRGPPSILPALFL